MLRLLGFGLGFGAWGLELGVLGIGLGFWFKVLGFGLGFGA